MKFLVKYTQIKKRNMGIAWKKAKMSKTCYLFLLPYAIVFTAFYILPVCMSIFYSFTYYNVLEPAKFTGLENYIDLLPDRHQEHIPSGGDHRPARIYHVLYLRVVYQ